MINSNLLANKTINYIISLINLEQQQGNNVLAIADSAINFVRDRLKTNN
jgi:hypothetical protein